MTYQILHNLDSRFDRTYHVGDRLADGYVGTLPEDSAFTSTMDICEFIFQRHNRDDRPDGKLAPSLSVGDVVMFLEAETAYSVNRMGFVNVPWATVNEDRLRVPWKDTW